MSLSFERQVAFVRAVAARRRSGPARLLARAARAYLNAYGNWDFDPETNGEARILSVRAAERPTCVFDVGANKGDWTVRVQRLMPQATVHAFELIEDTAERLRERLAGTTALVNAVGLADREGVVEATYVPENTELSGFGERLYADLPSEAREARLTTGDRYCDEHGVEHIDFLKIDAEGTDLQVLHGFDRMLAGGAVGAVQFEYGRGSILTHSLLRDFHVFLEERGFVVGKVFPSWVEFRHYDIAQDEDFLGPNYLAVRAERRDLIARLSG
jgi:FkbM family methyltransferase